MVLAPMNIFLLIVFASTYIFAEKSKKTRISNRKKIEGANINVIAVPTTFQSYRRAPPKTTQDPRPTVETPPPTPLRVSLEHRCDYYMYQCLRAYKTGRICGRTSFYKYSNFTSYCELDFVNCMEQYEIWSISHMGYCRNLNYPYPHHQYWRYTDIDFVNRDYVVLAEF